jgi:hypothetical protein
VPALAQSGPDDQSRSDNAQPDNQATSDSQQQASQNDEQQRDQNWDQNQNQNAQTRQDRQENGRGFLGRGDDEQSRREARQDQREDRRQEPSRFANRDRQPAIGVTVVERGGMGVRVMAVVPDSPAAQSGIRPGDTILEVEGRSVGTAQQLVALIQQQEPGDTAEFAVIREGREYQVPVRLATREQALPARLRRQDGSQDQQGRQFGQSNQPWQQGGQDPSWQQGQWQDDNRQPRGQFEQQYSQQDQRGQYGQQPGQFDRGRQFDQQGQYQGQSGYGPPQPPSPYTGAYYPEQSSTRQASYGEQGSDDSRRREPIGERLAQRLSQFEERLERIQQRLDQIERNGGIRFRAGSTDSSQTSSSQQTGQTTVDDDHDDEHDDDEDHQSQP